MAIANVMIPNAIAGHCSTPERVAASIDKTPIRKPPDTFSHRSLVVTFRMKSDGSPHTEQRTGCPDAPSSPPRAVTLKFRPRAGHFGCAQQWVVILAIIAL